MLTPRQIQEAEQALSSDISEKLAVLEMGSDIRLKPTREENLEHAARLALEFMHQCNYERAELTLKIALGQVTKTIQ